MKKILALILAGLMVFSLAACGNTETSTDATDTGNTKVEEQVKEMTPEELQAYYDGYFSSKDLGFAGTSISAKSEGMDIVISSTASGEGLFVMGIMDNKMEIYKDKTGNQFIHIVLKGTNDDGTTESIDSWYKYTPTENVEEDSKDAFASMSSDFNTDELTVKAEDIKSVEYVETKDGVDYIKVVQKATSEEVAVEAEDEVWTYGIDAKTHKIVTISQTIDNVEQTVKFSTVEKIDITIPENVENCTEEELAGFYMGIIFSAMGEAMGTEQ